MAKRSVLLDVYIIRSLHGIYLQGPYVERVSPWILVIVLYFLHNTPNMSGETLVGISGYGVVGTAVLCCTTDSQRSASSSDQSVPLHCAVVTGKAIEPS